MSRNHLLLNLAENLTIFVKHLHPQSSPENERLGVKIFGKTLSPAQKHALMIIGNDGQMNIKQLASVLKITSGAATQHVAALESLGAVERVMSEEDRREVFVQTTPEGQTMVKAIRTEFLKVLEAAFEELDDNELEQFVELMTKANSKYSQKGE
jgi:DNA-binding MarR family transcriptional regulator